jgi:hypothetical protein
MVMQTSIEWLFDYVAAQEVGNYRIILDTRDLEEAYEEAKEMHKQEIVKAFDEAYMSGYKDNGNDGINYFNETFKKD